MAIDEETQTAIKAKLQARDEHLRESWVRAMEARLVRDELDKCLKSEGVNHYESCIWLADKYLDKLIESKVKGYKQIDI
ncbi:hypothetical protein MPER_01590 [Moniliophthora perniciosa FA553]|nr:hypothetical protein MPER_01590 [Moniliophthora perniciosa FA553]